MLRVVEAFAVIANVTAIGVGFLWRRRRAQRRPSPNLDHMRELEQENEEMDAILARMQGDDRKEHHG